MQQSQAITIPQELQRHKDFALRISQVNQKIYGHVEYLKYLVQNIYQLYRKMSKSIIKLTQQYEKKMTRFNDATALSILNFIKGISKLFQNIRQQITNNTVNINKKNQKVSKTRKDIIHEKLLKIHQLFGVYLEKVDKYNNKQEEYESKCEYFENIQSDTIKFYSTKENKLIYEELKNKVTEMQQKLQETYSLKVELKSGICQLRLSLKEFFEMLSNNAEDDKKLLLSVRKKLKQTKLFNQTIIQQVNSQAEESVKPVLEQKFDQIRQIYREDQQKFTFPHQDQLQFTFASLNNNITINDDVKDISKNIQYQEICIELFCQFAQSFQKEIYQAGQGIDRIRYSQEYQKFIDKKFQINQMLISDIVYNTEAIKNQIADIRQIIQSIKALLDKKKVINQLKKYRRIKSQKFISQVQFFIEVQKKISQRSKDVSDLRQKYKQLKQKFAKGHFELMKRFRQMVQEMFKEISEKFKFQRNPDQDFRKTKNQFIRKKYFSLLMLNFFVNKEEPPKFQINAHLKNYEKYLSEDHLRKIGLSLIQGEKQTTKKSMWGCCGIFANSKNQKNKYVDEYNCALRSGLVLIQGKMKIHNNYLKFVSSFNAKTLFGQTNIRIPKWDIANIQTKHILLSLVIVINTIHGTISFTSFLSDPYQKLTQIYDSSKEPTKKIINRQGAMQKEDNAPLEEKVTQKTSNQTFHLPSKCKSPKNGNRNLIVELQEKFQSQIPQLIDKEVVSFQSLSTYLSQSKKQLSISVQYHLVGNKQKRYFFEIKLMERNSKLEYKFVHQKSMENEQIKKMLEKMTIDIINMSLAQSPSTPKKPPFKITPLQMQSLKNVKSPENIIVPDSERVFLDSCSFIERKQNNQFQFDNDPSFVYFKEPSVAQGNEDHPSFNYVPDLQIFKNMNSQRKITGSPIQIKQKQHSRSFQSQGKKSQNNSTLTKKEIDQYLNSIDQKDIKKNLFDDKTKKKGFNGQTAKSSTQQTKVQKSSNSTLNNFILVFVIIMIINLFVSILK